ncbi:hypothetical protein J6590_041180 [Homalodisca vitripennis]|nr:hypothetical protein J6590_041180 [Homalodisca vitripennis]
MCVGHLSPETDWCINNGVQSLLRAHALETTPLRVMCVGHLSPETDWCINNGDQSLLRAHALETTPLRVMCVGHLSPETDWCINNGDQSLLRAHALETNATQPRAGYLERALDKRVARASFGLGSSRMGILTRRIKIAKEGQKLFKMKNWRTYRKKIPPKHKKDLRQHWV